MQKPTLQTVAEAAGVSFSTVSRILSGDPTLSVTDETRNRVWQSAQESGYLAKRKKPHRLRSSHGLRIGVILAPMVELKNITYYAMLLKSIQAALTDAGHQVAFVLYHKDVLDRSIVCNNITPHNIDGLLVCGTCPDDLIRYIDQAQVPFTLVTSSSYQEDRYDRVAVDHVRSAAKAIQHLAGLGCRRIAYVGPVGATLRFQGYLSGMKQHGLVVDEALICESRWVADSALAATKAAIRRWSATPPDGLFAAADELAIAVMRALSDAGLRVPHDIRLVGHDDQPYVDMMSPSLTTIRVPLAEMGKTAVHQLIERISGVRQYPHHIFLPTQLVVRESCGGAIGGAARSTRP